MSKAKFLTSISSFFFFTILLLTVGIFVFNKTFHLAFFGDEWQVLWIIKNSIITNGQWDLHINQTIGQGYHLAALIMYHLTEYFGYDGTAVYVFSFITRFLATLTLFYFLKRRDCSNIVAFLGSLLFLITPIGLQATEWVKNFTSYISISFFLLCLDSLYSLKSWRNILFFIITFSISIYVNPIRSPGMVLVTTFLLIFQYFFNKSVRKKDIFIALFCSLAIFFLVLKMMVSGGHTIGQIEVLFASIGAALLPQTSAYYIILLVTTLLFWKRYILGKKYISFTLGLHALIIPLFFGQSLQISNNNLFTIIGIYFTFFMIYVFIIEIVNKRIAQAQNTALPFLLVIFFLIAPWLVGTLTIDPTHRYMIYSALSFPIILAFSINENLKLDPKRKSLSICIALLLLITFYLSSKSKINEIYSFHNQDTAKIIWEQLNSHFNSHDFKNNWIVTYFDSNNNAAVVHDSVTFGFVFHMGYIYNIWVDDIGEMYNKLPVAVDSISDFNSMITDGKAIKKYVGKDSNFTFPRKDAFYFKVEDLKVTRIENY